MSVLLFDDQNITTDMTALNNEDPNAGAVPGTFGILALGDTYTAVITPRTSNVTGYTFELAHYPNLDDLPSQQHMWNWSGPDRELVVLPGGTGTAEAQRLGTRFFLIIPPAGHNWGYVRISDLTGTGNPGVDMAIWRGIP